MARVSALGGAMFRGILVGVDGSKPALKAVDTAARLASFHKAELILTRVVQVPAIAEQAIKAIAEPGAKPRQIIERMSGEILSAALSRAEESGLDSGSISTLSAEGDRVKRITEAAKRLKADLMVVGSGSGTLGQAAGTAQKVVAQAPCLCLIVP